MKKFICIISNKFDFVKNNLFFRQINANYEIIIIVNFLNKFLFNLKNSFNNCVYNSKLINCYGFLRGSSTSAALWFGASTFLFVEATFIIPDKQNNIYLTSIIKFLDK